MHQLTHSTPSLKPFHHDDNFEIPLKMCKIMSFRLVFVNQHMLPKHLSLNKEIPMFQTPTKTLEQKLKLGNPLKALKKKKEFNQRFEHSMITNTILTL